MTSLKFAGRGGCRLIHNQRLGFGYQCCEVNYATESSCSDWPSAPVSSDLWSRLQLGRSSRKSRPERSVHLFSAVAKTESVTAFADGNRIVRTNTVRYFRDGQGRTRTERGEAPNRLITINDPLATSTTSCDPKTRPCLHTRSATAAPSRLV